MNRKILLQWPDLCLSATAELADDKNKELCDDLWNALPINSIMNNAVITDGSMYCWLPVLSFAPVHVKEKINEAPVGRLRYSQGTGNKLIVQYAECCEDVNGTVLGTVLQQDIETIKTVGKIARESIFMTKRELHVYVSRIGDTEYKESAKPEVVRPEVCSAEVASLVDRILSKAYDASKAEPYECRQVRTGQIAGVGSCGQYFSTWEFVYSLTRDLSMYTLYPLVSLCRKNGTFTLPQLEDIFMSMEPAYTGVLGSYGLKELRGFSQEIHSFIEGGKLNKGEFQCIIEAFCMYVNQIAAWEYFYYPWGIGCACYRFNDKP